MAKLDGGLLGRVTGKIGGIVFSSARGPAGKLNTARSYVKPANPQTTDQTTQRNFFAAAVEIVRRIGSAIYTNDWNRASGQNAGFQSLVSNILGAKTGTTNWTAPAEVNLGTLHAPATVTLANGPSSGQLKVTWSTELGDNGTTADDVVIICYPENKDGAADATRDEATQTRTDGATGVTFTGLVAGEDHVVGVYLRGAGTAADLLSPCQFGIGTAKA